MKRLVILGAGGYGKTVEDFALQSEKYDEILFLDDKSTAPNVIGVCDDFVKFIDSDTEFISAIGNNVLRVDLTEKMINAGANIATIIHRLAYVSPTSVIEQGSIIHPNSVVGTNCVVKKCCIVNSGAVIDHNVILEEGVHICLNAVVKTGNRIPQTKKIEAGRVIHNCTYPI